MADLDTALRRLYLTDTLRPMLDQISALQAHAPTEGFTLEKLGKLRGEVSTDEITPVAILSFFDARLAQYAHTGLVIEGQKPLTQGLLTSLGVEVLVAGARYGKGSSREHSPAAEKWAGIKIVFAESFERIYRQNADNIGLFTSTNFDLLRTLELGGMVSVDELVADREPLAQAILKAGGLLRYGHTQLAMPKLPSKAGASQVALASSLERVVSSLGGRTLYDKIVARHRLAHAPGFVQADWRFIHEYYTGMAAHMLAEGFGDAVHVLGPASVVVFEDHSSYVDESPAHLRLGLVGNMRLMQTAQREFVARHGLREHRTLTDLEAFELEAAPLVTMSTGDRGLASTALKPRARPSAGISHAMMAEHYALPGQLVAGTDSHTPHSGALGCVAFGVGTTDMANALVSGAVRMPEAQSVLISLNGHLPLGVTAKDVVLHLLTLPWIHAGQGIGKVFEFAGEAVRVLSIDERATLTNMTAEMGALTGIVAPDQTTYQFLCERRGLALPQHEVIEAWMHSDDNAVYAHRLEVDCTHLSPMVAAPGDPGRGRALSDIVPGSVQIDIAYGGSCTAGKREDFDHYHAVAAWAIEHGLKVHPRVSLFLQYGTTAVRDYCRERGYESVFLTLGARILQPSCGACANCGPGSSISAEQITVSAINRNFPGRSGPGQVWLASPPTVMASAMLGYLCSFEQLRVKLGLQAPAPVVEFHKALSR